MSKHQILSHSLPYILENSIHRKQYQFWKECLYELRNNEIMLINNASKCISISTYKNRILNKRFTISLAIIIFRYLVFFILIIFSYLVYLPQITVGQNTLKRVITCFLYVSSMSPWAIIEISCYIRWFLLLLLQEYLLCTPRQI